MEHQKVLWIVFSITLFLLVVVVVGFIWFLPPVEEEPDVFADADVVSESSGPGYDPIEWVRETEDVPGLSEPEEEESEDDDLLLVIGASDEESAAQAETGAAGADTTAKPTSRPERSRDVRVTEPSAPSRAELRTEPEPAPAQAPQPRTTTREPPPAARPETVRVTHYWIQAGSFSSRSRAEEAGTALEDHGFSFRITSIDMEGDTYFRVRIGPYDSKAEAEKFLSWLQEIDSYSSSYISEVYSTKRLN